MMPSNGNVSPSRNATKTNRRPGMRRCPMANPAMVATTSEIGTTPSTISTLDLSSSVIRAAVNAVTKLPHCGSSGHSRPSG